MTQIIEAIYSNGTLTPVEPLNLREQQRVRITVEPVNGTPDTERARAMKQLIDGLRKSRLRLTGPMPTREELHERH